MCTRFRPHIQHFLSHVTCDLVRISHRTRLLKDKKESNLLAAPPPPTVLTRVGSLGGTARGGGEVGVWGEFRNVQGLLYSNTPAFLARTSLTRSQTITHTRTQTDRLYEEVKGHSHPAGCSLSVLLSVLSQTLPAFNAACRCDIYKHSPQFSQSFYVPWRTLVGLTCIITITCALCLRHIAELWRKLWGNEQHILFP